jgi:hypothetical protein
MTGLINHILTAASWAVLTLTALLAPRPQRRSNCFASHPYRIMPVEPLIPGEL